MNHNTVNGWVLLSLLMSTLVYAYPQQSPVTPSHIAAQYLPKTAQQQADYQQQQYLRQQQVQPRIQHYQVPSQAQWQHPQQLEEQQQQQYEQQQLRKFAEKPNNLKKVSLEDIDDEANQIDGNAFSWTNMLGSMMQMLFANANANFAPPTKSDDSDGNGIPASPTWANVITAGMYFLISLKQFLFPHLIVQLLNTGFVNRPTACKNRSAYRRTLHDIETGSKVIIFEAHIIM